MKVHLYKYVPAAYDAWNNGSASREVALNQTECGFIRENITQDKSVVTCKLCLRIITPK